MINIDKLRAPNFIFVIYMIVSVFLIMIFRFIFPGSDAPLPIYAFNWRIIHGVLEVFNLFPALAFSALIIPFGLASFEENYQSFSDIFFKRLIVSIGTAIGAAVIYGIIFFFALPMVKNYEENLRFSGELYQLARKSAYECRDDGEWFEASQYLNICDRIWFNSPELLSLRDEIAINLEGQIALAYLEESYARAALNRERHRAEVSPLSADQQPLTSTQAISMGRTAFNEERYFDAHWLANLGMRLAVRGSAEAANATRLSSDAWNMISSLAPNRTETRQFELFNLKLSGYQAMGTNDWIRAYYIFQELLTYTPDDPDAKKFFAASETGSKETAFFIDEMELSLGEILNGVVLSIPCNTGRAVMRFSSLTTSPDIAYGFGFEFMEFDNYSNLKSSLTSRYVKLIPVILNGKQQIHILTHALDRYDQNNSFQSEWLYGSPTAAGIILDVSFEDLILISRVRRGLSNLHLNELFSASARLTNAGYVHQIFQAEILNRLGAALFFLPMAIIVIVIAWRYRAKQKPRYLFVLLLPVLPVVFHGFVFLYRSVINTLGIWLVLSVGFTAALVLLIITFAVTLFGSLIVLAGQHS
ncbi:MAG: hypothetical protein FWD14_07395 [Treponema sp.]|nr:hypothetical protein [Treponema sp.]